MSTIKLNREELIKEHKEIIPKLKRAGLKADALKQKKDLAKYKK